MSGIKYYRLGNNEEPPDEFCVVRDLNGEPAEYTWYEPIDSFDRELWNIFNESDWVAASEYRKLKAENAKLREDNDRLIQAIENLHDVSLEDRLVQLENENDNLQSQCADLVDERERLFQANVEKNGEVLRLVGENAKLREQIHWLKRGDVLHVLTDQELADQQKHEREMQASITALDAENATLRQQLADVTESMGRVEERCAKLRYLVEDMLSCIEIRAAFGRPPTTEMYEEFAQQARELGMEVDA